MSAVHTVVGAGALGTSVARALLADGQAVRVVTRSGASGIDGVEARAADIRDTAALRDALAGSTVVYQCAQPPYHRWAEEFPALQTAVLDAAALAGADLVIADNLYMYGSPEGVVITESTEERPVSRKGEVRRAMAAAALEAHGQGRLRVTLSRPSSYFGPGYDQTGHALFRAAAQGKTMQFLGRPDVLHSFSFVPDVAAAMIELGASDAAWGRIWIPPVQPAMTLAGFGELIWSAAGRDGAARTRYLGRAGARVLGIVSPLVREVTEMMYEFDEPYVVDSSNFEREFGAAPTPIADAIAATMRWYAR